MARNLEVVLRDDVKKLGRSGDIVRVRPGYARNFLLPRGLAVMATRNRVAQVEHERAAAKARAAKFRSEAQSQAKALSSVRVQITAQAGEEGKLFGSIGTKDIAEALKAAGQEIDRKRILLEQPIKQLGEFDVEIHLAADIGATIKVAVISRD